MKRTDIVEQAEAIRQAMNGAGEILTDEQALDNLWKSLIDNNIYTPTAYPDGWEKVEA